MHRDSGIKVTKVSIPTIKQQNTRSILKPTAGRIVSTSNDAKHATAKRLYVTNLMGLLLASFLVISTNLTALFCCFFCFFLFFCFVFFFPKNLFKGRGSLRKSVQTSLLRLVTEGLSSSSWVDSLLEVNHGGTISPTLVVNWALLHAEDLHYTESKCRDRVHLSFILLS